MVSKIPEQNYLMVVQYTVSSESFRPVFCRYQGNANTSLQTIFQFLINVEYIRKPRIVEQILMVDVFWDLTLCEINEQLF